MATLNRVNVYSPMPFQTPNQTTKAGLITRIENPTVAKMQEAATEMSIDGGSPVFLHKVTVSGTHRISHRQTTVSGYVKKSDFDQMNVSTVPIPANFAGLEAEMIPTRLENQLFRIYDVDEEEGYVTVRARHVWYDNLQNFTTWKGTENTEYTGAAMCRNILTNTLSPCPSNVASDCTDSLPVSELDYERKNIVEAFLDPENGICAKYGLSLIRNNWDFYCLKEVGYNRGFVVESKKNLLGVDCTRNLDPVVTRVCPIGKTAKGEIVWLNYNGLKYVDSDRINDYSHPRVEILDTGLQIGKDGVTTDNIQSKLLEAGQKRFSDDEADIPEVSMTVEFISLGDTEEYVQYRGLDKVYLLDILTIKDTEKDYDYSAQVIGVKHDILTGMLLSVTIGSLKQADGTRKIATWQVPEVDGANIRLLSIQAGSFAPAAIQTADLAPRIITADYIESGEIVTRHLAADAVTAEKIEANAVTAGKIAAGAVTTEKLDAYAVTAGKIAANAVSADKIAANAINADKIDATAVTAINAKLGTATIAQAEIASADINFAHIKDLNAQSAYFGQAIFNEAVGGKLYVPRLSVGYAQMVGATIGDLVIQASNGNYYGIDVDLNGNVTATQRTVTSAEIAAGHTTDGRTLVLGTDILATDLTTENIYASHALMDEIAAATISVDELWARTAFINKLMTTDISSNTYIQATIGTWTSGSTITQTINSLDSRIASLGYGTIYFQADEPSHSGLVQGDIWIQSESTGTWDTVKTDYASWQEILDTVGTWQTVGGIPKMWVWDGRFWQEMYDALLPITLETEIQQLADAITLRATKAEVDELANDITEFSAQLTIQAQEIQSAVSAVNLKAASYVMLADPRTAYTVSVGDIWIKSDSVASWTDVSTKYASWTEVKTKYTMWQDLLAAQTFVWNGSEWIETSDRAAEIYQRTLIDQTISQVTILAEAAATLNGELIRTQAQITVTNSSVEQEVLRATTAENNKLDKTSQYQTADSIVTAARNYVNGILTSESQIEQLATGITAYVADHAYLLKSGIAITAAGLEASGGKYVKIKSGGIFTVDSGNFAIDSSGNVTVKGKITAYADSVIGGWSLASSNLHAGSSNNYVALASSGTYAFWAGSETAASAPSRIKFNGEAVFTKLLTLNEQGQETEINLRTYALWKLTYATVKNITVSNGSVTIQTTAQTVNFNSAGSVAVQSITLPAEATAITQAGSRRLVATGTVKLTNGNEEEKMIALYDPANGLYDTGYSNGSPSSGSASGRSGSSYSWAFSITKGDSSTKSLTIDCSAIYSDARSGYTQGIFRQYSGATLYTIDQSGPHVYGGTLYTKS